MKYIAEYIPDKRLIKIRNKTLEISQKFGSNITFRDCIKRAIKEELSVSEILELATIFDANIEDITNYVSMTFTYDALELKKRLNITLEQAFLKIRNIK